MVTSPSPALPVGTVQGRFLFVDQDQADANTDPDYYVPNGKVKFICAAKGPLQVASQQTVLIPQVFEAVFDSEGWLVPQGDTTLTRGIRLPATDSTVYNPSNFTWKVVFDIYDLDGRPIRMDPFYITAPAGTTIDLSTAMPVSGNGGVVVTRGETGPPGDLAPVTGSNNVSGTVNLVNQDVPSTKNWTLTGNVTLGLPTPASTISGTITLVLTQDATGGRSITWPAGVKWSEGIPQQPATTAGSISIVHLLWTGSMWLGLLGGKSFA